jgi:hypothetical protein
MMLSDVLLTEELALRVPPLDGIDQARERGLLPAMDGKSIFDVAEIARVRCGAQSSGVSLFRRAEPVNSQWVVATGILLEYEASRFPLRHSLCGVASERKATQLFVTPQRYFKWIEHAGIYISEALVSPMFDSRLRCFGTIWVMNHHGARPRFDALDARNLEGIAVVAQNYLLMSRGLS